MSLPGTDSEGKVFPSSERTLPVMGSSGSLYSGRFSCRVASFWSKDANLLAQFQTDFPECVYVGSSRACGEWLGITAYPRHCWESMGLDSSRLAGAGTQGAVLTCSGHASGPPRMRRATKWLPLLSPELPTCLSLPPGPGFQGPTMLLLSAALPGCPLESSSEPRAWAGP